MAIVQECMNFALLDNTKACQSGTTSKSYNIDDNNAEVYTISHYLILCSLLEKR